MNWKRIDDALRRAVGLPPSDRNDGGRRDYDQRSARFAWLVVSMLSIVLVFSVINFNVDDHQGGDITRVLHQQAYDTDLGDFKTRQSQRYACHKSGNALRSDIRSEFANLKLKGLIPVYREIRDTLPPGSEVYSILNDAIQRLYGRVKTLPSRIPNAPCNELYPKIARPRAADYGL